MNAHVALEYPTWSTAHDVIATSAEAGLADFWGAAAAASFAGSAVGDGLAEAPAAGGRTGFGVLSDATAIPTASNIAATHPTITDLTQPGRDRKRDQEVVLGAI